VAASCGKSRSQSGIALVKAEKRHHHHHHHHHHHSKKPSIVDTN